MLYNVKEDDFFKNRWKLLKEEEARQRRKPIIDYSTPKWASPPNN